MLWIHDGLATPTSPRSRPSVLTEAQKDVRLLGVLETEFTLLKAWTASPVAFLVRLGEYDVPGPGVPYNAYL